MPDREKTIKGLEQCGISSEWCFGRDCPYWYSGSDDVNRGCDCTTELIRDALALLKEQDGRIKTLEHQLEAITRWRANAGAFD